MAESGALLRHRSFMIFVISRLFSAAAVTLFRATLFWQVFLLAGGDRSEAGKLIGITGLVMFAPAILFGIPAGAVADSHDRRWITLIAQLVTLMTGAVLYLLLIYDSLPLWLLYTLVAVIASASNFEGPARSALLPQLVPRGLFPRAVVIHSSVTVLAFMLGPVVAGFAIDRGTIVLAYGLYLLMVAAAALLMLFVRPARPSAGSSGVSLRAVVDGLRFLWSEKVVLGCMTVDMFAVILGGCVALLPVFAGDILQVGARGYGWLSAGVEVGAVTMALVLLLTPTIRRTGPALLIGVAVFAVATVVFGFSRSFPLSLGALVIAGMGDYVSVVMRSTAIQLSTPDEYRGRVSAVNLLFIRASNQLGAAESGFVAAFTSPVFSVVSGGVGALVVVGLIAVFIPELRRYRRDVHEEESQ